MGALGIPFLIISFCLRLYLMLFWARLIIEWVRAINPTWVRERAPIAVLEVVFTLTDPPIKFVRKFVKPIRVGQIMLDVSIMVVMLGIYILISLLTF